MCVDVSTYALSVVAEYKQQRSWRTAAITWSAVTLVIFSVMTAVESGQRVSTAASGAQSSAAPMVDRALVLGFSTANLCIDIIIVGAIILRRKLATAEKNAAAGTATPVEYDGTSDLNLRSAFYHVGTDFARATTMLITSLVLYLEPTKEAAAIDAIGALAVSAITFGVACFIAWELFKDVREHGYWGPMGGVGAASASADSEAQILAKT